MRVTHVITRLIVGGAQENTIASVLGLRAKPDLQVNLLSGPTAGPEGSLETQCAEPGLLSVVPHLIRPIHPWKDLQAYRDLVRVFQNTRPHIVHTHSGKAGFLGRLAAAKADVPVIVHTIHGPSFGAFQNAFANLLFTSAERRAARVTTHFVVVASAMREQYLARGIGTDSQYTKIFSGFDLEPFLNSTNDLNLRARLGLAPDDFVIGMIARLFKLKGHDDVLDVAPALVGCCPKAKFLLVGDGLWRERLQKKAAALGVEKHFVFAGLVSPTQIPSLIGVMDVLVHLSRREGLARALPQASATGRPIIAYDCDGAAEVCLDNQTGFLIKTGDLTALTNRVQQLAGDGLLRKRLGTAGRDFVRERFPVQRMVEELYSLYLRLTAAASQ